MNWRIKLYCGIATVAILLGCIENPGPDKNLGQEKAERVTQLFYLNPNRPRVHYALNLEAKRINGLEYLFVENIGSYSLASAEIQLLIAQSPYFSYPYSGIYYQRYIKIESLNVGQKIEIGLLDSVTAYFGQRWTLSADFLSIRESNSLIGSTLGGFYSGTFSLKRLNGEQFSGKVSSLIDIQGKMNIRSESVNPESMFQLLGVIKLDSSRQGAIFDLQIYNGLIISDSTKVKYLKDSLALTVLSDYNSGLNSDTLDIFLKRYFPSKAQITNIVQPGKSQVLLPLPALVYPP